MRRLMVFLIFAVSLSFNSTQVCVALIKRPKGDEQIPLRFDQEAHDINLVYLMVSNQGPIGFDMYEGEGTGFFPSDTQNGYVYGTGLWFGANYDADDDGYLDKVFSQGYDPLASGSEFREGREDQDPDDPLTRVFDSMNPNDLAEWPLQFSDPGSGEPIVHSNQDLVTTYTTKGALPHFGAFQLPLEVNQRSMAFISPDSINQVIFFVFDVTNTGDDVLTDAWIGFFSDLDVGDWIDDQTSIIEDRITPQGDTVQIDIGFAWDSDFSEPSFIGDPGFVGVSQIISPGNPNDGIDNDGDGLIDESISNGVDDDGDGFTDYINGWWWDWDEIDEIGLVNYSKECNPWVPCELNHPDSDSIGYDILSCSTPGSSVDCLESDTLADVSFMLSSGPFDWRPGQTQIIAYAFVFANSIGSPNQLDFIGDPPRPDPNDPALAEFVRVAELTWDFFHRFDPSRISDEPFGDPGGRLPKAFELLQNYPNPFNPITTIGYKITGDVGTQEGVELRVFDMRGHHVRTLVRGSQFPGNYEVHWDGRDQYNQVLPSGSYFYRLKAGSFVSTRRMTLVK